MTSNDTYTFVVFTFSPFFFATSLAEPPLELIVRITGFIVSRPSSAYNDGGVRAVLCVRVYGHRAFVQWRIPCTYANTHTHTHVRGRALHPHNPKIDQSPQSTAVGCTRLNRTGHPAASDENLTIVITARITASTGPPPPAGILPVCGREGYPPHAPWPPTHTRPHTHMHVHVRAGGAQILRVRHTAEAPWRRKACRRHTCFRAKSPSLVSATLGKTSVERASIGG